MMETKGRLSAGYILWLLEKGFAPAQLVCIWEHSVIGAPLDITRTEMPKTQSDHSDDTPTKSGDSHDDDIAVPMINALRM